MIDARDVGTEKLDSNHVDSNRIDESNPVESTRARSSRSPTLHVTRLPGRLSGDQRRVIARQFDPGGEKRINAVIDRVASLSDDRIDHLLHEVLAAFGERHKDLTSIFRRHGSEALARTGRPGELSNERRLLLGAYFTHEYSLESVALFNPSMVEHPDQEGLAFGSKRFLLSLRACGEGHISSIEFRSGVIDRSGSVTIDPPTPFAVTTRPLDEARYDKKVYGMKLVEMRAHQPSANPVLDLLGSEFTMSDLVLAIDAVRQKQPATTVFKELADNMIWLARSNYQLEFSADTELSERVIFPVSESESRGIEDARFVRFTHPDGRVVYYGTYTAYNGFRVLPQFIETSDFRHFKMNTLNGRYVQNKGMALFPRMIGGEYVMSARLDGENLFLLRSDNIHFWNESQKIREPRYPWEFIQVGNCGSPIETDEGWLLLTHGVGPMRQYWIGALLLDLADPARIIGELTEPMLVPNARERDGYVPNVVYSCGAMRHGHDLYVPYAVSDTYSALARVPIANILEHLVK